MRKGYITGVILLIFLGLFIFSYSGGGLPEEFPAPDFSLLDVFTGKEIRLSSFKGKPVVLYFFASW